MPACPIGMSVECARYNGCHECYGEAGPVSAVTDAEVDSVALVTFIVLYGAELCGKRLSMQFAADYSAVHIGSFPFQFTVKD